MNQVRKRRTVWFVLTLVFASSAFSREVTNSVATAFNNFGFELLRDITARRPNENVLISPVSLALCLALADQGAGPEAEAELSRVLKFSGLSKEDLRQKVGELRRSLAKVNTNRADKLQIDIADSVWVDGRVEVQAPFLHTAQTDFQADIKNADFSKPTTCDEINAWVTQKTHGKITSINCPNDSEGIPMAILNAVYFRDDWDSPFPEKDTKGMPFHGASKRSKPNFMYAQRHEAYADAIGARHVALGYRDRSFIMDLLLPSNAKGLSKLIYTIDSRGFEKSVHALTDEKLELRVPKFEFKDNHELKPTLEKLGLQRAFRPDSFPGIAVGSYISDVDQTTYIKVDEAGTEAAAVTEIIMTMGLGPPPRERAIKITFDHPFLFTIRHIPTGAILFLGAIWNLPDAQP